MKIGVNLASRPFADFGPTLRKLRIGMGVLALVAILLGVGLYLLGNRAAAARARQASLDASVNNLTREQYGYRALMAQPANATVLTQSEELNRLIDEKSFSWTLAMEDLETVLPGGVQVTTLEPNRDKKTGQISVRLRVVGPRDKAVDLVRNLEHSRHFLQPRIVAETAESASTGANQQQLEPVSASNRVNFDVLADYNSATLEEGRHTAKQSGDDTKTHTDTAQPAPAHRRAPRPAKPSGGAR